MAVLILTVLLGLGVYREERFRRLALSWETDPDGGIPGRPGLRINLPAHHARRRDNPRGE